jgi:hypothetical protein
MNMTRRPWISKKLAERRRRAMRLHLAGFTREEIADKLGVHTSVVCRDLKWSRDSSCPGESSDVRETCFIQLERMKFKGGTVAVRPERPPLERTMIPEEAAAS